MKQVWKFYDFQFLTEANPIEEWRDGLSDDARDMFDSILKDSCKIANYREWTAFRHYMGKELKGQKIWELGFFADGKQYRVLGIFTGEKKATLLVGYYHKGNVCHPANAIGTSKKRKDWLIRKEAKSIERKISLDK